MKVLLINGSPDQKGCIATALSLVTEELNKEGVETEIINIGNKDIRGCIACRTCKKTGKCVFNDLVNEVSPKLAEADGIVVGSPVYFGTPNGTVLSFMQRLFYSCGCDLHMKVGASIVSCRRGGNSATFETLNQFYGISGMPVVPSTYWNDVHGYTGEDVLTDAEGVETVRNMATNMVFLMKSIQAGKEQFGKPDVKHTQFVNFIR
ncbi:MAG: flavodoxin family protein [Erysipelotrichaceae bacterium]|nr:flavodoxin family protein [Erysipelotrichaceae bacterium]